MPSVTPRRLGWLLACAGLVAIVALVACEESSPPAAGVPDADIRFDSGASDSGSSLRGEDGAAPEGGPGASFTEPSVAVVNFWEAAVDFCYKPAAAADWIGPVFAAQGGIPDGAVSVRYPVPVESEFAFVLAGDECDAPIFTPGSDPPASAPSIVLTMRKESGDARRLFYAPADHVAGKEMLYFAAYASDGSFEPSGGGTSIELQREGLTVLEPNVTGTLKLMGGGTPLSRAMKTGSGVVLLAETSTRTLLCDELAPPNGHLMHCSADVRAP